MALKNIFHLGFRDSSNNDQAPLLLGKKETLSKKQIFLDFLAWMSITLGIFLKQGIKLPQLTWEIANLNLPTFIASVVVALALLGVFMRWYNDKRKNIGLDHFAIPFALGFFIDLSSKTILNRIFL